MATITARLDDWLDQELRAFWEQQGEGPSVGLSRVAREWWAAQHYPDIEFRNGPSGRRAGLKGGPDVWEIAMLAPDLGSDLEHIVQHFGGRVSTVAVEQALAYAAHFPDEIAARLNESRRLEALLSGR